MFERVLFPGEKSSEPPKNSREIKSEVFFSCLGGSSSDNTHKKWVCEMELNGLSFFFFRSDKLSLFFDCCIFCSSCLMFQKTDSTDL